VSARPVQLGQSVSADTRHGHPRPRHHHRPRPDRQQPTPKHAVPAHPDRRLSHHDRPAPTMTTDPDSRRSKSRAQDQGSSPRHAAATAPSRQSCAETVQACEGVVDVARHATARHLRWRAVAGETDGRCGRTAARRTSRRPWRRRRFELPTPAEPRLRTAIFSQMVAAAILHVASCTVASGSSADASVRSRRGRVPRYLRASLLCRPTSRQCD
jgi:hypothetical protein